MNTFVKAYAWVFGVLCIVSAILQYNDPDPLPWMAMYGVAALLSFGFALNRVSFLVLLVVGLVALAGGFYIFPEQFQGFKIGDGDIDNIEEAREAVGLFIIGIVQLFYAFWSRFWKGS